MTSTKVTDFMGYSEISIDEAINDALKKAGKHSTVAVVETCSRRYGNNQYEYQVTLASVGSSDQH